MNAPSVGLAVVLDEICGSILEASYSGVQLTELHVHPAVYRVIAALREQELARGSTLMLLGLRLVCDPTVRVDRPEVA